MDVQPKPLPPKRKGDAKFWGVFALMIILMIGLISTIIFYEYGRIPDVKVDVQEEDFRACVSNLLVTNWDWIDVIEGRKTITNTDLQRIKEDLDKIEEALNEQTQ